VIIGRNHIIPTNHFTPTTETTNRATPARVYVSNSRSLIKPPILKIDNLTITETKKTKGGTYTQLNTVPINTETKNNTLMEKSMNKSTL